MNLVTIYTYLEKRFGHSNEMAIERELHREARLEKIADKRAMNAK